MATALALATVIDILPSVAAEMVYGVFSIFSAETEKSEENPGRINAPETIERLTSNPPPQNVLMVDGKPHSYLLF